MIVYRNGITNYLRSKRNVEELRKELEGQTKKSKQEVVAYHNKLAELARTKEE